MIPQINLFRTLDFEFVKNIIDKENTNGEVKGVIVQFGGQTPLDWLILKNMVIKY